MKNSPNLVNVFKDSNNPKSPNRMRYIAIASFILLLGIVGTLGYMYMRTKEQLENKQIANSAEPKTEDLKKDESTALLDEIGKLIILPKDEQPTIATVSDLTKLQGQQFFAKAQLGDKVLVYNKDRKAILYRPSENKIIELAPLLIDASDSNPVR